MVLYALIVLSVIALIIGVYLFMRKSAYSATMQDGEYILLEVPYPKIVSASYKSSDGEVDVSEALGQILSSIIPPNNVFILDSTDLLGTKTPGVLSFTYEGGQPISDHFMSSPDLPHAYPDDSSALYNLQKYWTDSDAIDLDDLDSDVVALNTGYFNGSNYPRNMIRFDPGPQQRLFDGDYSPSHGTHSGGNTLGSYGSELFRRSGSWNTPFVNHKWR